MILIKNTNFNKLKKLNFIKVFTNIIYKKKSILHQKKKKKNSLKLIYSHDIIMIITCFYKNYRSLFLCFFYIINN